jgi:hypothetical protein
MSLIDLAEEANRLPFSSVVFPICAAAVFAVLGLVTWSYRDVAHRHADKGEGTNEAGAGHH